MIANFAAYGAKGYHVLSFTRFKGRKVLSLKVMKYSSTPYETDGRLKKFIDWLLHPLCFLSRAQEGELTGHRDATICEQSRNHFPRHDHTVWSISQESYRASDSPHSK